MDLVSAQGRVREGAHAIDTLLHLLRSRRVGPKAIASALIEVRDGCPALIDAIGALSRELLDHLSVEGEAGSLARSLLDRAAARVDLLMSQLGAIHKPELEARSRLAVEAFMRAASADLEGLLFLVDLLACAATRRETLLDARDVLEDSSTARLPFSGDARIVGGLLTLAQRTVEGASGAPPRVKASALPGDRVQVLVIAQPPPSGPRGAARGRGRGRGLDERSSARRPSAPLPPEAHAVALAVAAIAEVELSIAASGREVTLVLGAPPRGVVEAVR